MGKKSSELLVKGTEGGGSCKRGVATLLAFNPEANTLEEVSWLGERRHLEPTGFKSVSQDQCVLCQWW